ncbi:NadS family protein [Alcaligenaceae bacterium A4P071]|nr:NadS family protein [Alcaligenaceae bacterium B3P038]MDQ2185877.1 NadS family protein [Alcaligenaceae bacterium A4P071]
MDKTLFDDLAQSLSEAAAIRRGTLAPSRLTVIAAIDVRAVRERTQLTQAEFATAICVSIKTLQNWEQRRRMPTGPAVALLRILDTAPEMALKVLAV